jgi:NTE family protein
MSTYANRITRASREAPRRRERPPFECIALLLQGGGALGAYQAGVYEALSESGLHPDWVAGISIGAINSALIAGNPPETRVDQLRRFWNRISTPAPWGGFSDAASAWWGQPIDLAPWHAASLARSGDLARTVANQISAGSTVAWGATGFFAPRVPQPWLAPAGALAATSYYDTAALKTTLENLVDFDRINAGETRFSVGAVNVESGNLVYFDNTTHAIRAEHVMASGALPPGLPAVEIEGEHYWDGGLVSNTPLHWVVESKPRQDTLAFQVDLWSARGAFPRTLPEVATRQKEIQYSSRTRASSSRFRNTQRLRNALGSLLEQLPPALRESPELAVLAREAHRKVYNLVQLIYRSKQYEGDSKDYDFSRQSMKDHWRAGHHDTVRTLRHPEVFEPANNVEGVFTFDLERDGRM